MFTEARWLVGVGWGVKARLRSPTRKTEEARDCHLNKNSVKAMSPCHCAVTSILHNCCFNCCAEQSHKDMSIALLLSNNWSKRSPPFWSLAIAEQLVYYAVAVSTAVQSRVTRTVSVALLLSNKWSRKVQLSEPSSTSLLLISSGLSWGSSTTSLLLISPGPTDESLTSLWEFSSSPSSWSHLDSLSNLMLLQCCFMSTETIGLLGTGAQDNHLDFSTAPELWLYLTRHFSALCTLHCKTFWSSASESVFFK